MIKIQEIKNQVIKIQVIKIQVIKIQSDQNPRYQNHSDKNINFYNQRDQNSSDQIKAREVEEVLTHQLPIPVDHTTRGMPNHVGNGEARPHTLACLVEPL